MILGYCIIIRGYSIKFVNLLGCRLIEERNCYLKNILWLKKKQINFYSYFVQFPRFLESRPFCPTFVTKDDDKACMSINRLLDQSKKDNKPTEVVFDHIILIIFLVG